MLICMDPEKSGAMDGNRVYRSDQAGEVLEHP